MTEELESKSYIFTPNDKTLAITAELMDQLCQNWTPHQPQVEAITSIAVQGSQVLVCKWGRQTGKSEMIIALAGLWSQLVPGSQSYYFAPQLSQAREILWTNGRILEVLPGNWIENFKETESRLYFTGSKHCYLKVDGCDKFDRSRGISIRKGILFLDECRDMKEGMLETILPALGVHRCPIVMTSTPPEHPYPYPKEPTRPHWFNRECERSRVTEHSTYLEYPTSSNPHFPKDLLERQREELYAQGKGYVYEREFEAKDVYGGVEIEFPMLANKEDFIVSHETLVEEISRDRSKLDWYCMTDPAAASVWAWMFACINPYTKVIYVLDEIYETVRDQMLTSILWPKAEGKILELYKEFDEWNLHYDEAETWFANEVSEDYGVVFSPSYKASKSKRENLDLMGNLFYGHQVKFSDRCEHTYWELMNYKGEKDKNDHEVDNFRYLLTVSGYSKRTKGREDTKPQQWTKSYARGRDRDEENEDWCEGILAGY